MNNKVNSNVLNDITILYELSLSLGQTLILQDNISKFVNLLMARKNLNYVSVWLKNSVVDIRDCLNNDYSLVYATSTNYINELTITSNHIVFDYLNNITSFTVSSNDRNFKDFIFENEIEDGSIVFYSLGDFGFLKFYDKKVLEVPPVEINKLTNLMQKFTNSISACLYYERALYETEERTKSENRYKNIFNSITDSYSEIDFFTGVIKEMSPSIKTIVGYDRNELLGKPIQLFYASKDIGARIANDIYTSKNHEISDYEVILINKSKEEVHCSFSMRLIFDDNGKPDRIVGTMRDITRRKNAEATVLESEQKWRALVDNSPDRILALDRNGNVVFENRRNDNSEGTLQQASLCTLFSDGQHEKYISYCKSTFENRAVVSAEINCDAGVWLLTRFVPVFRDDDVEFVLVIATDISEQKKLEQDLSIAKNEADAANAAKGRFLANMSHEIRNPMNAIIGNSELLFSTSLNTEQGRMLNNLKLSADSLLEIIYKILDFSKIETDKLVLKKTTFLFNSEIAKIYDLLHGSASNKTINLSLEIDSDIPKIIRGDILRLKQVLLNLLTNAIKFTKERGKVALKCKLESIKENKIRVLFLVEDTGIGIDKHRLEEIFDSFNQVDSSFNPQFGGTGLGLSISRNLVNIMGGDIMVESTKGAGSKFFFSIDLEVGDKDKLEDKIEYSPFNPNLLVGIKILVAEDSEFNQDVARRILENWGAKVLIAEDGQVAVNMIMQDPNCADFIFMDIRMPIMDGIEATRKIRSELGWKKPIVALTGEALKDTIKECSDAGMNDFVSKPFVQKTIESKLRKYLDLPDKLNAEDEINKEDMSKSNVENVELNDGKVVYSTEALMEMLGGSQESLNKILQKFIEETPARAEKMELSYNSKDWNQLQSQAHTIKTSLHYLMVDASVDDCQNLEDIAKEEKYHDSMKPLVDSIKNVVDKLVVQVKEDYSL
jgi:PAS domain S-box-containing protein